MLFDQKIRHSLEEAVRFLFAFHQRLDHRLALIVLRLFKSFLVRLCAHKRETERERESANALVGFRLQGLEFCA